eukprot:gnl/TRDRNA2_/TRDRNA2_187966_c0_seq1.p1 gnl/TRDRNA2_/TRDRNA2_187966_c0~~gnl/TRDRNA2_/TRDRNA2_187966_c0_seq1.p1  ORF type:complete len:804 (-),score=205.88 gnl/TRDRNA2_/TRDRNA2_187966_c0_seq1:35-2386(-)
MAEKASPENPDVEQAKVSPIRKLSKPAAEHAVPGFEGTVTLVPDLPKAPNLDSPLAEFSFGRLTASIEWLFSAVQTLNVHLGGVARHSVESHREAMEKLAERIEYVDQRAERALASGGKPTHDPAHEQKVSDLQAKLIKLEKRIEEVAAREPVIREVRVEVPPPVEEPVVEKDPTPESSVIEEPPVEEDDDKDGSKARAAAVQARLASLGDECVKARRDILALGAEDGNIKNHMESQEMQYETIFATLRSELENRSKPSDLEEVKLALEARINEIEVARAEEAPKHEAAWEHIRVLQKQIEELEKRIDGLGVRVQQIDMTKEVRRLVDKVNAQDERFEEFMFKREEEKVEEQRAYNPPPDKFAGGEKTLQSLSQIDIQEEVRRLRMVVEQMRGALPALKRQAAKAEPVKVTDTAMNTTQGSVDPSSPKAAAGGYGGFQAASGGGQAGSFGGADPQWVEERIQACEQMCNKEHTNLRQCLKNHEKDIDYLKGKIEDLFKKFRVEMPKMAAFFEPLSQGMRSAAMSRENEAAAAPAIGLGAVVPEEAAAQGTSLPLGGEDTDGAAARELGVVDRSLDFAQAMPQAQAQAVPQAQVDFAQAAPQAALQAVPSAAPQAQAQASAGPRGDEDIFMGFIQKAVQGSLDAHRAQLERVVRADMQRGFAQLRKELEEKLDALEFALDAAASAGAEDKDIMPESPGSKRFRQRFRDLRRSFGDIRDSKDMESTARSKSPLSEEPMAVSGGFKRQSTISNTAHEKLKHPGGAGKSIAGSQSTGRLPALGSPNR